MTTEWTALFRWIKPHSLVSRCRPRNSQATSVSQAPPSSRARSTRLCTPLVATPFSGGQPLSLRYLLFIEIHSYSPSYSLPATRHPPLMCACVQSEELMHDVQGTHNVANLQKIMTRIGGVCLITIFAWCIIELAVQFGHYHHGCKLGSGKFPRSSILDAD